MEMLSLVLNGLLIRIKQLQIFFCKSNTNILLPYVVPNSKKKLVAEIPQVRDIKTTIDSAFVTITND
jgi:hypothetical protein